MIFTSPKLQLLAMSKNKKPVNLSWDAFQSMGNPDNAPEIKEEEELSDSIKLSSMVVRVYLERKKRGGKTATIVKGIEWTEDELIKLTKEMKSKLGVGGAVKDFEIILQGDKREKVVNILKNKGFSNTKNAGA